MAADANLIKGAAAAYGAGTAAKQAGIAQIGNIAAGLTARVDNRTADLKQKTSEAKERKREIDDKFYENQEAALLQGGALGTAEFDLTQRKVAGLKKQYNRCKLGDEACQRKVMMQLSQESQALTTEKDTRKLNAEAMKTLRGDVTQNEKHIMGVYSNSQSGDYTIDEDASGERTYTFNMPDGSQVPMTSKEVQRLFEKQQDAVGSKATKDLAIEEIERGKRGEPFDEFKTGATFDNLLKDDNSLISALNDDWGVGNFSASIDNKIENELATFKGNPDIQGLDIPTGDNEANWYDNITKEDVALIKERLMNPQSDEERAVSRNVAKQYYVDAMRQQNENGVKQATDAAAGEQSKRDNENYQKFLDRQSREKVANINQAGANLRDPEARKDIIFKKNVKPAFSKLAASMYLPNQGDGAKKKLPPYRRVENTLAWLESYTNESEIIHRSKADIAKDFPNLRKPSNFASWPDQGYYEVVQKTDYRKELENGDPNPDYGLEVDQLELINGGSGDDGFELDLNKVKNRLDYSGAIDPDEEGDLN